MRSLKTKDKEQAKEVAYKIFAEILTQKNTTGSTSPKDIKSLSRKYIDGYELLRRTGQKGGSQPNVNRQKNVIGRLLHALNECTEWGQVFILDALVVTLYISFAGLSSLLCEHSLQWFWRARLQVDMNTVSICSLPSQLPPS